MFRTVRRLSKSVVGTALMVLVLLMILVGFAMQDLGSVMSGNLGMSQVAKSAGDGYTVLLASSSIVVNPSLYAKVPYDIDKDFIPVTKAGGTPNSWVVHASHPAKTMKDLIELIKREPGKHSVGSPLPIGSPLKKTH